ncbi:MAG TPA: VWA domain-containing protein [Vicinamibacterales bacterium]|nr:VWA domain-containing protein [Vicinamibacterales bacterium]
MAAVGVLGAAVLASLAALPVRAQQPSFKAETRLVVLRATVRNRRGIEVTDLDQSAFTVYEDGKRQPITVFRRDDIPVSLALLIDNSGSMRRLRERVERAALAFVHASNPLDEVCVINFADRPHLDVPLTSSPAALTAGIRRVDSIGGTALRDAVAMGESYLHDHAARERHVLLVITDGRDNASETSDKTIAATARQQDIAVYAIGLFALGDSSQAKDGRRELDALTEPTGGVAEYPTGLTDIDDAVVDLARQIRRQYTIAYAPTNQALDGTYRRIRVDARGREPLVVRTRAGYVADRSSSP